MEAFLQFTELIIFGVLVIAGYLMGSWSEMRHYKSLKKREAAAIHTPAVTMGKSLASGDTWQEGRMVVGSAVISIDYFKRLLASLVNIFGGRVANYETLVDRARREALLRMREEAGDAAAIVNVRVETSSIGNSANRRNAIGSVEAMAFGTALYR